MQQRNCNDWHFERNRNDWRQLHVRLLCLLRLKIQQFLVRWVWPFLSADDLSFLQRISRLLRRRAQPIRCCEIPSHYETLWHTSGHRTFICQIDRISNGAKLCLFAHESDAQYQSDRNECWPKAEPNKTNMFLSPICIAIFWLYIYIYIYICQIFQ